MGDAAIQVFIWGMRIVNVAVVVMAFIVILNLASSLFLVGINQSVLTDLLALVQMWLPFDLNVLTAWVLMSVTAFFTYKLAVIVVNFTNDVIGRN